MWKNIQTAYSSKTTIESATMYVRVRGKKTQQWITRRFNRSMWLWGDKWLYTNHTRCTYVSVIRRRCSNYLSQTWPCILCSLTEIYITVAIQIIAANAVRYLFFFLTLTFIIKNCNSIGRLQMIHSEDESLIPFKYVWERHKTYPCRRKIVYV